MKSHIFTPMNEPARFVDDYLLYLLARASHAASAGFHARLKARGVAVSVWRVVATLHGAPEGGTVGGLAAPASCSSRP
jgi:hypothetical protein